MPLIPVGPNNYMPSPSWSRNGQLHEAYMNRMMMQNQGQMQGQYSQQRRSAHPAQYMPALQRPRLTEAQRQANAQRYIALMRPDIAQQQQAQAAPQQQQLSQGLSNLANEYQQQLDRSNQVNERRYRDINQGYGERQDQAMDIANLAANQQYRLASAQALNDLTSRGLRNSTNAGNAYFDAYERSQQIPLNTLLQTSGDQLRFQERRNDVGPDVGQLIALSQMQGQLDALQQGQQGQIRSAVQPMANTQQFGTHQQPGGYSEPNFSQPRIPAVVGAPIYQSPTQMGYQMPTGGVPNYGGYGGGMQGGIDLRAIQQMNQAPAYSNNMMQWAQQRRAQQNALRDRRRTQIRRNLPINPPLSGTAPAPPTIDDGLGRTYTVKSGSSGSVPAGASGNFRSSTGNYRPSTPYGSQGHPLTYSQSTQPELPIRMPYTRR